MYIHMCRHDEKKFKLNHPNEALRQIIFQILTFFEEYIFLIFLYLKKKKKKGKKKNECKNTHIHVKFMTIKIECVKMNFKGRIYILQRK